MLSQRKDTMNNKSKQFVHLHNHFDQGSLLDGLSQAEEAMKRAAELNQPALGLSDHGMMPNAYEMIKSGKKYGVKAIIGIEAYITPGDTPHTTHEPVFFSPDSNQRRNDVSGRGAYTHMTMIAENNVGMKNLFKMNSLAYNEGNYGKPRMSVDMIAQNSKGIIATTGCPSGELQTRLRLGQFDEARKYVGKMQDIFGKENYFLELMDHDMRIDLERAVRGDLMKIAKDFKIPLLATNDTHYVHRGDAKTHEYMLCIQSGSIMSEPSYDDGGKRFAFQGEEYYLKTAEDMYAYFSEEDYPGAITNTLLVAERSNISLDYDPDLRPELPLPPGYTGDSYLREQAFEGLARKIPHEKDNPVYIERLNTELDVFVIKNFSHYMLVVSDFMRYAKDQGWECGPARGCLSGSTLIPTSKGYKALKDIVVGDTIFDEKGNLVEIPRVFEYDCDEELISIDTFYGAEPIKMTSDHKVLVSRNNSTLMEKQELEWLRADEINVGDLLVTPKLQYSIKMTEVKFGDLVIPMDRKLGEFIGLVISDGEVKNDKVIFTLSNNADKAKNLVKDVFNTEMYRVYPDAHIYELNSPEIVKILKDFFTNSEGNLNIHRIPLIIMHTSEEFRHGLMNGLALDNVTQSDRIIYNLSNKELAYDIHQLLNSLGINSKLTNIKQMLFSVGERLKLESDDESFNLGESYTVIANLNDNFVSGLPYDGKFIYRRVRNISTVPSEGKVYDFTVPTTTSYTTESFVVHNSGGGSLLAYCIDITEIDPIPHGLMFERFLNPERDSPPDIDSDFDDVNREKVMEYVKRKYGNDKVANIITYGRIKTKNAIKDVTRIFNEPYVIGEKLTKLVPPDKAGFGVSLKDMFDEEHPRYIEAENFRTEAKANETNWNIVKAASKLEGRIRNHGVHAAGVIMSSKPLSDTIPLWTRKKDGVIITQFDYPTCEDLGLIKMDFLGIRNLRVIEKCFKGVELNHNVKLNSTEIYNSVLHTADQKTYEMLSRGDTLGVFQLDSGGITSLVIAMKPDRFGDISAILALYRPGPMGIGSHLEYVERKHGRKSIEPIHPELEDALKEILDESYGVIVFQEQIMKIAQRVAGYTLGGADSLRRIMGKKKKKDLDAEFPIFRDGMLANGYSQEACDALWNTLIPFAEYGFNKSHSAGYGLISYLTAYLKAHYAAEFMAANLSTLTKDKDKTALYLNDCRHIGIKVLPPSVSKSHADYIATPDGQIRVGLNAIRSVGFEVTKGIVEEVENNGEFKSLNDFMRRAPKNALSKGVLEGLIQSGALDEFGYSRRALMGQLVDSAKLFLSLKKKEEVGLLSLFDSVDEIEEDYLVIDNIPEYAKKEKLALEKHAIGLYVSDHPLSSVASALDQFSNVKVASILSQDVKAIPRGEGRQRLYMAGVVTNAVRKVTKAGKFMGVFDFEDVTGAIPAVIFPATFERLQHVLKPDTIYKIVASILQGDSEEDLQLSIEQMEEIETTDDGRLPFRIYLSGNQAAAPGAVDALQRTVSQHRGEMPVFVHINNGENVRIIQLNDSFNVDPSGELNRDLMKLFGTNCISQNQE